MGRSKTKMRRDYRHRKKIRRDAINQSMVTPPVPTVQTSFRRHYMGKYKNWSSEDSPAPYGTFYDYDKELNEEGEWTKAGPIQQMPIHGPVNWDQIWYNWDDIGRDYEKPLAANCPLSADQLEQMHEYANKHGRVRNIQFIRPVGQGNNASVWMVEAQFFKPIKLACKVIRPPPQQQQASENMVSRFKMVMDDLSALSRVSHPNIVKYYDVITIADEGTKFPFSAVCIFTEMCHGDVLNILDEMPVLDWSQSRSILRQISEALSYLHNEPQGLHTIVHLDIKPENILFKMPLEGLELNEAMFTEHWEGMTFKLTDFGTSLYMPRAIALGPGTIDRYVNTPPFGAPEMDQLATTGEPIRGKPCDVYSLGMSVLSTMIRGAVFYNLGDDQQVQPFLELAVSENHDQAIQVVQQSVLDQTGRELSPNQAMQAVVNVLNEPNGMAIILDMVRTQPEQRITIQEVVNRF